MGKIGDLISPDAPAEVKEKGFFVKKCWFTEMVRSAIEDERSDYVPKSFQPSSISGCDRANEYFILGIPTRQPSADSIFTMDTGTYGHMRWENYFKKVPGLFRNHEFPKVLERFDPHIRAKPDAILSFFDEEYYLVEIKFTADETFQELLVPVDYHVVQWQIYSEISNIHVGCLLYFSFDPRRKPKIFELTYNPEIIEPLYDRLRNVEKAVADKVILPKQCTKQSMQYRYCSYKKHCYDKFGDVFVDRTNKEGGKK